jgi:hypothetical protein
VALGRGLPSGAGAGASHAPHGLTAPPAAPSPAPRHACREPLTASEGSSRGPSGRARRREGPRALAEARPTPLKVGDRAIPTPSS